MNLEIILTAVVSGLVVFGVPCALAFLAFLGIEKKVTSK